MQPWLITSEERIVVVFDICSSSKIIEDLASSKTLDAYLDLVDELKQFLYEKRKDLLFAPYKFTGDGWILVFPPETDGQQLLRFVHLLTLRYRTRFKSRLKQHLKRPPKSYGLTIGIDFGTLHRVRIFGVHEYMGPPIVIASRLQVAAKGTRSNEVNRLVASARFYKQYFKQIPDIQRYSPVRTFKRLRNIRRGAKFPCYRLEMPVCG